MGCHISYISLKGIYDQFKINPTTSTDFVTSGQRNTIFLLVITCTYYRACEGNSNQEVFFKKGHLKGSFPKKPYTNTASSMHCLSLIIQRNNYERDLFYRQQFPL